LQWQILLEIRRVGGWNSRLQSVWATYGTGGISFERISRGISSMSEGNDQELWKLKGDTINWILYDDQAEWIVRHTSVCFGYLGGISNRRIYSSKRYRRTFWTDRSHRRTSWMFDNKNVITSKNENIPLQIHLKDSWNLFGDSTTFCQQRECERTFDVRSFLPMNKSWIERSKESCKRRRIKS
jgi:hypothetical protein